MQVVFKSAIFFFCVTVLLACSSEEKSHAIEWAASQRSRLTGRIAPAFSLPDQDGKIIELASLRGQWIVVYFYPHDDTPGCTCQATEFTRLLKQFHDLDAQVLGISPDSSADHRFFIKKYELKLTLLSDADHTVSRRYGAWQDRNDAMDGRVLRSTVLIAPDGTIAWHWPEVIPQNHAARVHEKLLELSGTKKSIR